MENPDSNEGEDWDPTVGGVYGVDDHSSAFRDSRLLALVWAIAFQHPSDPDKNNWTCVITMNDILNHWAIPLLPVTGGSDGANAINNWLMEISDNGTKSVTIGNLRITPVIDEDNNPDPLEAQRLANNCILGSDIVITSRPWVTHTDFINGKPVVVIDHVGHVQVVVEDYLRDENDIITNGATVGQGGFAPNAPGSWWVAAGWYTMDNYTIAPANAGFPGREAHYWHIEVIN